MLRTLFSSTGVAALLVGPAVADPMVSVGLTFHLGGDIGLSASVWSDDREEELVGGLTGTYYFRSGEIGAGVGLGYVADGFVGSVGYD
ncbi:MAG: hypothetical protein GYB53_24740, partial [Rhodobacteraceae bacterium]|nr:hypothetical protein [Paracoccaceae bacterium]